MFSGIEVMAILILACAVSMIGSRRIRTGIWLYCLQSLGLATIAAMIAHQLHEPHIYAAAGLALAVKAIAIPTVMLHVYKRLEIRRDFESFLGITTSLLVSALLVAISFYAAKSALGLGLHELSVLPASLLGSSLSNVLLGFFMMINRKKALSQVIGLSVMENGLFLAAIALTSGMPLVIEIGILAELLVAAMLMGILIFKIGRNFDSIDTQRLSSLKDYQP